MSSKSSTTQGNIRVSRLKKRLWNFYKKENFKPEIKPVIENLQDGRYQLQNKQAKGAKFCPNIRWELEVEKCSKKFFQSTWKTEGEGLTSRGIA